jgi:hypothetical protein
VRCLVCNRELAARNSCSHIRLPYPRLR